MFLILIAVSLFLFIFLMLFLDDNYEASKESTCQRITDSLSLIIQNRDLEIIDIIEHSRELNRQLNAKQTEMSHLTEKDLMPVAKDILETINEDIPIKFAEWLQNDSWQLEYCEQKNLYTS